MKFTKIIRRRIVLSATVTFLVIIAIVFICDRIIVDNSNKYIFNNSNDVPNTKVALVLGASKYLKNGLINPYFEKRMLAAQELYLAGKVDRFVLSGDNSADNYNEPEDMRNALIAKMIPDSIIYLDYAGFRTLDSVVRLNKIFGQSSFIIVSQKFHNERAVYIARYLGLDAYGYNAPDVNSNFGLKTRIREKFARVKVFLDILVNKNPKFLGDKIDIE